MSHAMHDQWERRYDGPILPHDPVLAGRLDDRHVARALGRLAGEARSSLALRRSRLDAVMVPGDSRLGRTCRDLRFYRDQAARIFPPPSGTDGETKLEARAPLI